MELSMPFNLNMIIVRLLTHNEFEIMKIKI